MNEHIRNSHTPLSNSTQITVVTAFCQCDDSPEGVQSLEGERCGVPATSELRKGLPLINLFRCSA